MNEKLGGPCTSNRFSFRLVAGAWSLAAFIFVQAYNSTLLTYVLTTINNPLVNSPYEMPERKDVHLLIKNEVLLTFFYRQVTKRNFFNGLYLLFQSYLQANSTITLHKKLGERLNAFPQARCKLISECISLLTPGSNYVYLDVWQNEEKQ